MTLTLNVFTPLRPNLNTFLNGSRIYRLPLERASKLRKRTIFNVKPFLPSKKTLLYSYKVFIRYEVL